MSYDLHNFKTGEVIEAWPVNEMDAQIKYNAENKVETSAVGAANGVASLDPQGKIPKAQIPISVTDDSNGNVTMTIG
jgi:hypothetical protein